MSMLRFCFRDLTHDLTHDLRTARASRVSLSNIRTICECLDAIAPTRDFATSRMMIDPRDPLLFVHNLSTLRSRLLDVLSQYDADLFCHEPLCLVHDIDPDTITRDPLHTLYLYIDLYLDAHHAQMLAH